MRLRWLLVGMMPSWAKDKSRITAVSGYHCEEKAGLAQDKANLSTGPNYDLVGT